MQFLKPDYRKTLFLILCLGLFFVGVLTVTAGEIKITNPNPNRDFKTGETVNIKWTVSADVLPYVKIELVDIEGKMISKISGGTPKDSNFIWSIPTDITGGEYRVKIYTNDLSSQGISEIFHISHEVDSGKLTEKTNRKIDKPSETSQPKVEEQQNPQALPRTETPKPKLTASTPKSVHQGVLVTPVVKFQDTKLEEIIRKQINKASPATIFSSDFRKFITLKANSAGIKKINGLEYLDSLETLDLSDNNISDIGSLAQLKKIRTIKLANNQINDISVLANNINITQGVVVVLTGNPIDCKLQADNITRLKERGVKLEIDCP